MHWIFKNKDQGKTAAAASLGLISLWDVEGGLPQVDKFLYSKDPHVVAGALPCVTALWVVSLEGESESSVKLRERARVSADSRKEGCGCPQVGAPSLTHRDTKACRMPWVQYVANRVPYSATFLYLRFGKCVSVQWEWKGLCFFEL